MSLLGSAILTVCLGAQGNYQPACTNALEQSARTTGFDEGMYHFETKTSRYGEQIAKEEFGQEGVNYLGSTIYLVRVVSERRLIVDLPRAGLADQITSQITPSSFFLSFKWGF